MAKFDPDAYLAAPPAAAAFDPDAYLASPPATPPSDPRTAMFERGAAADTAQQEALRAMFGPQYAPGNAPIGLLRGADVARGATLEQRQRKFQSYYPQGGIVSAPTPQGQVELARTGPNAPYQTMGGGANFLAGLVSEPTIGGMIGAFGGPAGVAAGTAGGVLAQNALERARGFGDPNIPIGRAVMEGSVAGATDAATRRVIRAFGGGAPRFAQAPDPVRAAKEHGLEPLAVGQMSRSPLVTGMYRQVGATAGRVQDQMTAQERSLLDAFRRNTGQELSEADLTQVVTAQRRELDAIFTPENLTRADTGRAIQDGIESYKTAFRRLIDQRYTKADALGGDVRFDLSAAQNLAREIDRGVQSRATPTPAPGALGVSVAPPTPVPTRDTLRVAQGLGGELGSVVQTLMAMDPNVTRLATETGNFGAFQQVRALRTRLWDLKSSDDPMTRREASRLWASISDSMYNPITENPEVTRAFRRAAAANTVMEDSLSKTYIMRAAATDTPEQIARKLFHPGAGTEIATLKRVLPQPAFRQVQQSFMADLAREETAAQGLNRLRSFRANDPQALDAILSRAQQDSMEAFLTARQRLESGPMRQVFQDSMSSADRAATLLKSGQQEIANFVRLGGGVDSPAGQALRAAVYKDILDSSLDVAKSSGVEVLNAAKVAANITRWQTSGKLDGLFRPEDWARLKDFRAYATPVGESADIGGPMMAGALRQRVIQAASDVPDKGVGKVLMGTLRPLVSNQIAAYLLSRPAGVGSTRNLVGGADPYRQLSIALTSAHREMDVRRPRPEYTGPTFRPRPANALSEQPQNALVR